MIDKSKLKPFDAEAAKRGAQVIALYCGYFFKAQEVSEKTDRNGDHAVLLQLAAKIYWRMFPEKDLFMLDAEPEQEILPQPSCSQAPVAPAIDWEQRTWEMYIAVITDAMKWQEYKDIETDNCFRYANEFTDAYSKYTEEKK